MEEGKGGRNDACVRVLLTFFRAFRVEFHPKLLIAGVCVCEREWVYVMSCQ